MKTNELKLYSPGDKVKEVDTLEEFLKNPPQFNIFKSEVSGFLRSPAGDRINVQKGVEYCFNTQSSPAENFTPAKKGFLSYFKRYRGENLDGKTLGVWREGGIGDLLFARPILIHLKKLYPTCKIFFATRERYHPLIQHWTDCFDGIDAYPFQIEHIIKKADYHLTFQGVIEKCRESNRTDVYEMFARTAGLDPAEVDFTVPMELPDSSPTIDLLKGSVVVQTMASSPVRVPRIRTFIRAIDHITAKGFNVVISDGPLNQKRTDQLISCVQTPGMVHNLTHYTKSLVDAVNLITEAPLVVAPDSSHAHFAGCQGIPLVALYGPFPGAVRTKHYKDCLTVETPENKRTCKAGGRYCFLHNSEGCQYHERCWMNLADNQVIESIDKLIGG